MNKEVLKSIRYLGSILAFNDTKDDLFPWRNYQENDDISLNGDENHDCLTLSSFEDLYD